MNSNRPVYSVHGATHCCRPIEDPRVNPTYMTAQLSWLQLIVSARSDRASEVESLLEESGALAVSLSDAADDPLYEPPLGTLPLWPQTLITGLFDASANLTAVMAGVTQTLGEQASCRVQSVADQDWERVWLEDFRPLSFGTKLWVCPQGWEVPDPGAIVLRMDPGLAFGTGTHPTTALCLTWLGVSLLPDTTVIDYGCGSGILGLAALRLGAARVWAVDNDPQALWATLDNAARNDIVACSPTTAQTEQAVIQDAPLWVGPPECLPVLQVDLLLVNILARTIVEMAPRLIALVRMGGGIVLSGILVDQASDVLEAYRPWFDFDPPTVQEGWIRLTGIRRA